MVEECFWFNPDGVVKLDFAPVWQAAQNAIPAGRRIWEYNLHAEAGFPSQTIAVGIREDVKNRCCDTGVVIVKFRVDHGRVVVVQVDFDPEAKYQW